MATGAFALRPAFGARLITLDEHALVHFAVTRRGGRCNWCEVQKRGSTRVSPVLVKAVGLRALLHGEHKLLVPQHHALVRELDGRVLVVADHTLSAHGVHGLSLERLAFRPCVKVGCSGIAAEAARSCAVAALQIEWTVQLAARIGAVRLAVCRCSSHESNKAEGDRESSARGCTHPFLFCRASFFVPEVLSACPKLGSFLEKIPWRAVYARTGA